MNGTITVSQEVSVSPNEDLCIGSRCLNDPGEVSEEQYYGEDGIMDGPVRIVGDSGNERGIVAEGSICFGTC